MSYSVIPLIEPARSQYLRMLAHRKRDHVCPCGKPAAIKEWRRGHPHYRRECAAHHAQIGNRCRRLMRKVDTCERCGSRYAIGVHHIDRDRFNNRRSNMLVLCRHCHTREHANDIANLRIH